MLWDCKCRCQLWVHKSQWNWLSMACERKSFCYPEMKGFTFHCLYTGFLRIRLVKETFCSNVFFLTIPPSLLLNQNGSPAVHYDTWLNATPSTFTNYMDATFYPASMNFLISIRATEAVFALCQTRWTDLISNFSALPSSIALFLSSHATVFTPILSSNWFCYWFTWLFYKVPE